MYICTIKIDYANLTARQVLQNYSDTIAEERATELGLLMKYRVNINKETGMVVLIYKDKNAYDSDYNLQLKDLTEMLTLQGNWVHLNHGTVEKFSFNKAMLEVKIFNKEGS